MTQRIRTLSAVASVCLAVASANAVAAESFEFLFWPAPAAEADPRFIAMHEGPCGEVASARVQRMPIYSRLEPFAPEQVFELSDSGAVLRKWSIPVDTEPYALDANDLIFSYNSSLFRVTATGSIRRQLGRQPVPQPQTVACKIPAAFKNSTYANCWRHVDLRTNRTRTLAYLGTCT